MPRRYGMVNKMSNLEWQRVLDSTGQINPYHNKAWSASHPEYSLYIECIKEGQYIWSITNLETGKIVSKGKLKTRAYWTVGDRIEKEISELVSIANTQKTE